MVGPNLALLGQFFLGYRVTFMGSLIGFVYGFGCGFVTGYLVASLYNWIVELRRHSSRSWLKVIACGSRSSDHARHRRCAGEAPMQLSLSSGLADPDGICSRVHLDQIPTGDT